MSKIVSALLSTLFFVCFSNAQEFHVKGTIVDSDTKVPLDAATVYAESLRDSTMITYTITEPNGTFELEGKTDLKEVRLNFSYNGYKPLVMRLNLKPKIDLGFLHMEEMAEELQGVQVVAERVPLVIKKDTLEFNADSFKTRPDATVEDVLKKLPGVDVDTDGKITVNGKEVNKVLVNGQVFFSNDPTVATKSLPKDVISKIQITDTKTKTQEYTGQEGDGENKTINLTIKEDKNKGYLGRGSAGYGTNDRYQANGLLNYFKDKERISFIGTANNINNAGFSFDEVYDMVGNTRGGYNFASQAGLFNGYGKGITTSSTLGASYANKKKNQYEVNGNYFFSYSDSYNDQRTTRENILPDSKYYTETISNFNGTTNSNMGSAGLEFDIDKTLRVNMEPYMNISRTNSSNLKNTISTDEEGNKINSNETMTADDGMQRNFANRFGIIKKLDTVGKFVRFSFNNRNIENQTVSRLNSLRNIYGDTPSEEILDQQTQVDNDNDNYELEASFRQPLGNKLFLDVEYEYDYSQLANTRSVYDYDKTTDDYTLFNETLSSDFDFRNVQQTSSLSVRKDGKKLRYGVTAGYTFTNLRNQDYLKDIGFAKKYENLLFDMYTRYTIGKNKRFRLNYNSNLDVPSVSQLQPVPNVNNPLNIIIGNPNLKPAISHRIRFNYSDYNWKDRTGFYVYMGITMDENRVSQVTVTDEDFIKKTTYTNVNGNYDGYGGLGYSKQVKKDSTFTAKFNFRPSVNFGKNIGFTNGVQLEATSINVSPRAYFTFNFAELLELEPRYSVSFNNTKYNLEDMDRVKFISHNATFRFTTYWPENLIWGNDITYQYNGDVSPGFDKDALFWNASLGYQMMKKNGTLKVSAYDLLNQNNNTRRTTGQDFIQDFQGTVLKRYFMLSFSYKFDQFGGKKPGGGWRS
ncbi:outer membrane beta-barrel protein [Flavobacteriaceae bacterium F89]|uniref:Outer membrane beta-barrel protein n=1 Tax=Cerina litoralis TaxID=2874477 RepID=A0AAE3EUL3_9FLAO|nr:outer membrane beta-barrel protein [Cerina litoralis]MCG2459936.1 outer membrane beta-barrel protein [Cerina litoralis]